MNGEINYTIESNEYKIETTIDHYGDKAVKISGINLQFYIKYGIAVKIAQHIFAEAAKELKGEEKEK